MQIPTLNDALAKLQHWKTSQEMYHDREEWQFIDVHQQIRDHPGVSRQAQIIASINAREEDQDNSDVEMGVVNAEFGRPGQSVFVRCVVSGHHPATLVAVGCWSVMLDAGTYHTVI